MQEDCRNNPCPAVASLPLETRGRGKGRNPTRAWFKFAHGYLTSIVRVSLAPPNQSLEQRLVVGASCDHGSILYPQHARVVRKPLADYDVACPLQPGGGILPQHGEQILESLETGDDNRVDAAAAAAIGES